MVGLWNFMISKLTLRAVIVRGILEIYFCTSNYWTFCFHKIFGSFIQINNILNLIIHIGTLIHQFIFSWLNNQSCLWTIGISLVNLAHIIQLLKSTILSKFWLDDSIDRTCCFIWKFNFVLSCDWLWKSLLGKIEYTLLGFRS